MSAKEPSTRAARTIERVRERKQAHRQRGKLYRISFGVLGVILVIAGALLTLPGVPGPGLLIIAIGVGMLALEFDRAERLLDRILLRLERVTENAARAPRWQKAVGIGVLVLAAAAAVAAALLVDVPLVPV